MLPLLKAIWTRARRQGKNTIAEFDWTRRDAEKNDISILLCRSIGNRFTFKKVIGCIIAANNQKETIHRIMDERMESRMEIREKPTGEAKGKSQFVYKFIIIAPFDVPAYFVSRFWCCEVASILNCSVLFPLSPSLFLNQIIYLMDHT